jgi:mxaJ protein
MEGINPMRLKSVYGAMALASIILLLAPPSAKALRVCADPNYLPYSNQAGEGFENKIAQAVAQSLGEKVEYTWASNRGHGGFPQFLSETLDAGKCDVVMDIPYGSREELTTRPYYTSSYVFVYKKSANYNITSMDSPALRNLKIGFEQDTPPEDGLKLRGLISGAIPFDIAGRPNQSPAAMLEAVQSGKVDVVITWEPAIGAFLKKFPKLEVAAVPNGRTPGGFELYAFPMAMGVRENDDALKNRLDAVIAKDRGKLQSILNEYGVKLYAPQSGVGAY